MYRIFASGIFTIAFAFQACNSNEQSGKDASSPVDTTLQRINALILNDPDNAENYYQRAIYLMNTNNPDGAMDDINRALRADSTEGKFYASRAEIFFSKNSFDEALNDFEHCFQKTPELTDCALKAAEIHLLFRRYDQALTYINNALRQDEYLPKAYFMKGLLYVETGDTALAVSSYQTATEVDPDFYEAYISLGFLYAKAQNDLAIEYYSTAISLKPRSVEALYDKAIYLQDTGFRDSTRFEEALSLYDKILEIDPTNSAAAFNKGFIYLEYYSRNRSDSYAEASKWFSKAIELYPMYYQAFYNRGLSEESLGNLKQAESDYREALRIEPDYTPAARSLGRVVEGQ